MADKRENDLIFIGAKPIMNYVTSIAIQFNAKNKKEVTIKARGKFISKAVDIAEVCRRRFLKHLNLSVKEIKISSEEFESKEKRKINVSCIEITLIKK